MTLTLKKDGSPTIFLWGDYREKERILGFTKEIEIRQAYAKLIDAFYDVVISKQSKNLDIFKVSAAHKSKLIWEEAFENITRLSHYFEEFDELLGILSKDQRSEIRLRVVQSLCQTCPSQQRMRQILTSGLKDKSKKVRAFSIERIQFFNLKEFLPSLKEISQSDSATEILRQNTISFLEFGYFTQVLDDGTTSVTFAKSDGMTTFFLNKKGLSEEKIKNEIDKKRHS